MTPNRIRAALAGAGLLVLLAACAGAPTPLPEADTDAARFYAARCGACHAVPHPGRHTAAEWDRMLALMDVRIAERAMPALEGNDRERIRAYLARHARGSR